jgi:hypothetical protein
LTNPPGHLDRDLAFVDPELPNTPDASGKESRPAMGGEVHGEGGGRPGERLWGERYRGSTRPSNGRPRGTRLRLSSRSGGVPRSIWAAPRERALSGWPGAGGGWPPSTCPARSSPLRRRARRPRVSRTSSNFSGTTWRAPSPRPVRSGLRPVLAFAGRGRTCALVQIAEHASVAPGSWAEPDTALPTPALSPAAPAGSTRPGPISVAQGVRRCSRTSGLRLRRAGSHHHRQRRRAQMPRALTPPSAGRKPPRPQQGTVPR